MGLFKKLFGGDTPEEGGDPRGQDGSDDGGTLDARGGPAGEPATPAELPRDEVPPTAEPSSEPTPAGEPAAADAPADEPAAGSDADAPADEPAADADQPAPAEAGATPDAGTSAPLRDRPRPTPPAGQAPPAQPSAPQAGQPAPPAGQAPAAGAPVDPGSQQLHIDPARGIAVAADGSGRQVDPQVYKEKVLPVLLEKAKDNPDLLYQLIVGALAQQANEQALAGARRLEQVDSNAERSTAALAAAMTQAGQAVEAEALLRERMEERGATPVLQYQLARALAAQERNDDAEDALWESLEADPNNPDSVQWWAALKQQQDPEAGLQQGFQQADAIEGAWYPALWLARFELEAKNPQGALAFYERALPESKGRADALTLVSGDLGRTGHHEEMMRLILPMYEPRKHGPYTGMNLAFAAGQVGRVPQALALLEQVEGLGVAMMKPHIERLRAQLQGGGPGGAG